jgi:hypothetical protein
VAAPAASAAAAAAAAGPFAAGAGVPNKLLARGGLLRCWLPGGMQTATSSRMIMCIRVVQQVCNAPWTVPWLKRD